MQALSDIAPLAAFLIAYRLAGIYTATAVLMAAMVLLVLVDLLRTRRVSPMHLASTVLVLLLGGATLILRDARFLKWKPTLFLWLVALIAAASTWIGRAPLAQRLLAPVVAAASPLPRRLWVQLNWLWVGFYLLCGGLNLWVAQVASERAWVDFKVFGLTAAFLVFAIAQAEMAWRVCPGGRARDGRMNTAAPVAAAIRNALQVLSPQHVEVHDDSAAHAGHASAGGKGHFRVRLVSTRFLGLRQLQRHRMVNELLAPLFETHIHALTLETLTPEEYGSGNQRNL